MDEYAYSRLETDIKKKLTTVMVGAVAAIENRFDFLWGKENPTTESEIEMFDIFEQLRTDIFDLGNAQIKNMLKNLQSYDIERKKFTITGRII